MRAGRPGRTHEHGRHHHVVADDGPGRAGDAESGDRARAEDDERGDRQREHASGGAHGGRVGRVAAPAHDTGGRVKQPERDGPEEDDIGVEDCDFQGVAGGT